MISALVEALAQAPGVAPSIGRIVHYCQQEPGGPKRIRPAIVVAVEGGLVELCVFWSAEDLQTGNRVGVKQSVMLKDGQPFMSEVSDEHFIPGTWRWPPRV